MHRAALIGRWIRLLFSYWLLELSLLESVIAASRAIRRARAKDKQARPRLETVWSLSEIDKIADGVFFFTSVLLIFTTKPTDGNGIFFFCSPSCRRLRPRVARLRQKIYFIR